VVLPAAFNDTSGALAHQYEMENPEELPPEHCIECHYAPIMHQSGGRYNIYMALDL